jgi:hypothetical protein
LVPKEHEAYHAMWRAATEYFRALQELEVGKFAARQLEQAEQASSSAIGQSLLAQPEDIDMFYSFWQGCVALRETAYLHHTHPKELEHLWGEKGKQLGGEYLALRERFVAHLRG